MVQIKKDTSLRKAILQAAITGQLISDIGGESLPLAAAGKPSSATPSAGTPRNAPTETGKQLLDRIIEERNKKLLAEWKEELKKKPKAKKPALIVASEIDEDEIPFEIPENWCWCRLKDIFFMQAGKNISSSNIIEMQSDENPYPCFGGNGLRGYVSSFNKDGAYPIIGRQGALCGCINIATGKFYATEHAVVVDTFGICNYQWASWFLIALNLNQYATATAQPGLAVNKIETVLIPLPPLSVQNAIVAKLEQVLPLVDAYENAVLQKEELKSTLPDKVKKAILQEAITGKLTEQWRKQKAVVEPVEITENGEQLLARIIKERNAKTLAEWEEKVKTNPKAKKPVPIVASEIEEDEIPFEIPESWCWCRLGDLVSFGQCENAEPNEIEDEAWILDLEDIEKDTGRILQFKNKKEVDSKSTKHVFKKGYVLYSKLRPYLNKCVIAPKDGYCTSEILPLDFGNLINNKFAQIFLMSPYFVDYTDSLSFGVKMPRLGTEDGKKALVPLPSLEEQKDIVKKVEELLPLCR